MAKLLSYYSLCPINDVREFLGLSRDVDTGCVINTLGRNIIQVVKLSNQKLQHSWTSLDRLTSKVVYDFRSERYVAVFGNRQIRSWNRDQADINKVKKLKFFRNILELFTLDNGQVLVLYDDGTCESLESAVDTRNDDRKDPENILTKPNIDPTKETILNVTIITLDSGDTMLAYFVKDQEGESLTLNYVLLEKESLKSTKGFHKIKLERIEQKVHLVGQSIVDGSGGPCLITIWSDKRIFSKQLVFDEEAHQSIGNFISILNMINTSQPLSMIGISRDYVAIYANNLNQDGATLLLYNVQFKVVQAKQLFKVYFNNSRFWLSENHILLAFGQTLAVVPFKISKEQLSDMVGTQRSNELRSYVDNESINEDCDFNEGFAFVGNLQTVVDEESEEEDSGPENAYQIFKSIETFEESLRKAYKSNLQVDVLRDESLPEDTIQMRLMANVDSSIGPLVFSEKFEIFVSELEKHGFCEMEITDKILPLMIESNASLDIGKCLKRYSTVSERALVSVLQYALSCNDQSKAKQSKIPDIEQLLATSEKSTIPPSNPSEEVQNLDILNCHDVKDNSQNDLLNIVLSCSFNRRVILPLVRKEIDLNAVLRLLDHLYFLLTDPVASLSETPTNCDNFDSDEKVIEWAMLLIDSHYQQIILSRDREVREKIINWMNIVKQHIDSLKELKSFAPTVLRLVENKAGNGDKRANKWYSIETVQLY